ncbi:hypothetical protein BDN72DRAFT_907148, partial [Pluteus cervinus]
MPGPPFPSFLTISGIFLLGNRELIETSKTSSTGYKYRYAQYDVEIHCLDGSKVPAEIRKFSLKQDEMLANGTVAYVFGKFIPFPDNASADDYALVSAIDIVPIPGNISDEYYLHVPMNFPPCISGVGYTPSQATVLQNMGDLNNS